MIGTRQKLTLQAGYTVLLYSHCRLAYEGARSGIVIEDVKGQFVIRSLFISDFLGR